MRESFVIHAEYIEDLPEEYKGKYLMYIYEYGINDIEPELEGLELALWYKIKRRIDTDRSNYNERVEYVTLYNAYKKALKSGEITKDTTFDQWKELNKLNNLNVLKHLKQFKTFKTNEMFENFENNSTDTDTNTNTRGVYVSVNDNVSVNESVYVNDIVNVSDNVNESVFVNESENVSVSEVKQDPPLSKTPMEQQYSKTVFEIFKNANLPCAKENEISFLMTDYSNALRYLHSTPEYEHIHSDDVIGAVKNYVEVYQDKNCYIKNKMNFYQLVKSKIFYNLLPSNFDRENFITYEKADGKKKPAIPEAKVFKELCPKCKTKNLYWRNGSEDYWCEHCSTSMTYEEVKGNGSKRESEDIQSQTIQW